MNYPAYYESFDYGELRRTFLLGEEFANGFARWPRRAIEDHQNRLFLRCIERAWQIPFYQRLWGARGLTKGDVQSLGDIGKLPIFGKSELMQSIAEHPPYGDYHGWDRWPIDSRPVTVIHTTSGTTGRPQVVLFSPKSREVQALLVARCWQMQGLKPNDVLHSVYGHGMINGGHFVREAALHYTNNLFLSAGTGKETRSATQIELMRDLKATVIVGFVDYIRQLAETAREMAILPGRDLSIRAIFGHVGRESREVLSRAWGGAAIYDWYGVADTGPIAAESLDQDGMYVMEDAEYLELIDADTGAAVQGDAPGDMVVTALYRDDVYPLIRFNTHDLTSWSVGKSSLGWNLKRVTGVHGRSDNMVKLRGINVYPLALAGMLNDHPAFAGEYVCRARRAANGRDELTVIVETRADRERSAALHSEFVALLTRRVGVEVAVELVAPGATAALTQVDSRQKPIRLVDERPKDRIL